LDENPAQSTSELERLNVEPTTVIKRLHDIGKIHEKRKWVSP